ncbi:MAG: undecaprenyl-diphosphate phosphatase [Rhizobiales bacterium]|nr:undecaprenyl-diphosphate phosphatase [Hyphomicrobiales bacterium]
MSLEQIIILSIIQGITEFLPISSSGHLAMVPHLTSWPDQGIMSDVALHFGSLIAVVIYFHRDMVKLFSGMIDVFRGKSTQNRSLFLILALSTVPVFVVGYILKKSGYIDNLRSLEVIAWANIIFAIFLYIFDKIGKQIRSVESLTIKDAVLIGLAQCIALIPGSSRSGTTMTMGRLLGFKRDEAARFSMLMSIPTILGASALLLIDLSKETNVSIQSDALLMAALSFVVAFISIWGLMAMLKRMSMTPFVIYRLVLGAALIAFIYKDQWLPMVTG